MEQDTQLKKLLANSAEGASPNFTDAVMKRVNALYGSSFSYQPLVSPRLQRLFLFTFGALVVSIVGLCVIIALPNLHIAGRLQSIEFPNLNYNKIFVFII